MATTDSSPNVGSHKENIQNSLEHNMYKNFFDAVDDVYSLLQSQNALQIKQLSMLVSKLKELKNISIPQGQLPEFINCALNYIEIVLTFISTLKDYTRQKELVLYFLYMIPYFFNKPEEVEEFMKEATVKILELFMFGNFSIVSNRELLGTFNSIAIKSSKETRTAVAEKTLYYMYKLIDSLSTYGDYGLQADIMETLFRIYGSHIRGKKIKYDLLPGSAELSEELATNISSDNFDLHVRHWLNKFNQNSSLIFTLPCQQLVFGDVAVKNIQEFGPITWLDFDLKEQIIGFYMEGRDSTWNRVIFFAKNVSNVNVNRQFTTYNKTTTVTVILSKPCISEAMDSQDYCNSLSKELKIVISNEERDKITKLISHVLPKIFGDVFTHSSSRISQKLKQVYKPLRMKVSKSVPCRRSITDVENLNVSEKNTPHPIHTVQENVSLPEIKYSCLARESIPSTSRSLSSYNKKHVQLAKRPEQNGESCHNCSFVLTEFSRTDVASDRASLIPSRSSEVFSSRGSSHNAACVSQFQSDEQIQENMVASDLVIEDDIPLSSTIEIISGHCQRSHSCSLITENVEFKHSEVFSSSPVKRSTHSSQLQLIENTFCSTLFNNGDFKGTKTSVFKTSEEVMSDKYETAVENLIELDLEDALHHQEIPRFHIVEVKSQKETVPINIKVPEKSDVFPTITDVPLVSSTKNHAEDTTSQDLFATSQSCSATHELSVNNSNYICDMPTHENKKAETETFSEDRNFTELSMTVNIGAASDKLFSESAVFVTEEGKVQNGEIVEVFIDLTEDEPAVEKHGEKLNVESQIKNMNVDAEVVQNTTNAEVLPVSNISGLLGKSSKHEYADKASEEVVSDKFETAVENLVQLELEAAPDYQNIPRFEVAEIKSQNETVIIDKKIPDELEIYPTIMNAALVAPIKHATENATSQDLFATTQRCCSDYEITANSSEDIFCIRTQQNKKTESQIFPESKVFTELNMAVNIGAASDEPFSELAAPADRRVRIQGNEVAEVFIDLTEDEPDVKKHLDKPDIETQLENMNLDVDAVQNSTDVEEMPILNTQELLGVLGKSSTHESSDKDVMSSKTSELPPTFIVIDDKSNAPAKCVQRKPRRLIKMGKKLFHLDNLMPKIGTSGEGPTIEEVNSKTADVLIKQTRAAVLNTLEEVQVINGVQKKIDETAVSLNSKVMSENLTESPAQACITIKGHSEDVIESIVKNVDPGECRPDSSNQTHNTFKSGSITHDAYPNCYNSPQIETSFTSLRHNSEITFHPTENSEFDFDFLQKTQKSQKASQESVMSDLILKKSAKRLVSNDSMEALPVENSEDKIHPNCSNPSQIEPILRQLSIIVSRMVIPHPINSSQSDFDLVQKTYVSEKASSDLDMNNFIVEKPASALATDDNIEALATAPGSKGQKVEDSSKKNKTSNTSFNSPSRNLKVTNFTEPVDSSSIVSVLPTIVTTVAAVHCTNNEETTNNSSSVIASQTRLNTEEQAPVVTSTCIDHDVIETIGEVSTNQRNPIIIEKVVNAHPISNEGVYVPKSPSNKSNSIHVQQANSPVLTINKIPKVMLNRLDLKTKKISENYVETDSGIDEILHLWDKKQDNDKNEKESDKIGANSRRVLYKEGSFSYLDDIELTTRTTPEMSQTPEPIEVTSKKKKTKNKQQKDELLSTKETSHKNTSLRAKKKRQSVKPAPLLYDPVASKNLREIFEKTCENIFNRTTQNYIQIDPMNRAFELGNLDVAVRGVKESENSHHSLISPVNIMSPKSPQLPELDTPPDLTWPEIETVPKPAINVLQHIVVPSQASKRQLNIEVPPPLDNSPPKKIRLDENIASPSISVVSNHTSEITDRALSIITYVCSLANQRNETASTNLGLIMDFIDRLKQ
ncbi:uro-adherence factor A-like isoform X2 [Euwallacea fornicatus]|uniref:uro-adherence factor A-like isoform X2 n=1 Tax=Euwallacea fornicatus TaxID=995702 RepID=UPI00338E9D34